MAKADDAARKDTARTTEREIHGGGSREPQDRSRDPGTTQGEAESPVDSMHVDAPTQQKNKRGHQRIPQRDRYED